MMTICYVTARKEPYIQWFFGSLERQAKGDYSDIRVVVVDFYAQTHLEQTDRHVAERKRKFREMCFCPNYLHVPPKPTPWQGPHRLTKHDYFAAANTRNTGIIHCPDSHIAFVDDLSVLQPGWLDAAREAATTQNVVCGAFRKVSNIKYELFPTRTVCWQEYDDHPAGHDPRWISGDDVRLVPCAPQWFFGCSLVAPIEAFLKVNGYPESADSMGYEDCVTGIMIARHGYQFMYDKRLLTFEDESKHHLGTPKLRVDKGVSPNDRSHAFLKKLEGAKQSGNPYDLRLLRDNTLNNVPFSCPIKETHDWFDGMPLSEM